MKTYTKDLPEAECVGLFEPGSEQWHEIRSQGIGGSELGTILGLNPWESAYTLFHKRLGNIEDSVGNNWAIRFGNAFEQPILDLYAEEHPDEELLLTGTYINKNARWMHANPDALAKVNGEWKIIEVKTARAGWSELPPHYEAQVVWYMMVTGIKKATLVAVAGMTWQEFHIDYDEFMANAYKARAFKFWEAYMSQVAPDWDGSKSTYETQRRLHSNIEDKDADIPKELYHLLKDGQEVLKQAESDVNKVKSQILHHMGTSKYGHVDGQRVVSRQSRRDGAPYLVINK